MLLMRANLSCAGCAPTASSAVLRELQMRVSASGAQQPLRQDSAQQQRTAGSEGRQQGAAQPAAPKPRSPLRRMPTPPKMAGLAWKWQQQLSGPPAKSPCGPAHGPAVPAIDQEAAAPEHAVLRERGCSSSAAADDRPASSLEQPAALSAIDEAAETSSPLCAAHCEQALPAAAAAPWGRLHLAAPQAMPAATWPRCRERSWT